MNDTEAQAHEFLRRREWVRAAELFDQLLGPALNNGTPKERVVGFLLGRSECCLELGRHEAVVSDCRRIIKLLADAECGSNNGARARRRLVHALFSLRRFSEAEAAAREWLAAGGGATNQPEALKMLERLRIVLQMANGQKTTTNHRNLIPQQRLDEELLALDSRFESWTGIGLSERPRRQRKHPVELIGESNDHEQLRENTLPNVIPARRKHPVELVNAMEPEDSIRSNNFQQQIANVTMHGGNEISEDADSTEKRLLGSESDSGSEPMCSYCCLTFSDRMELRAHCQSESHQNIIMSDEGRDWKWRPPPRGLTSDAYSLCESWADGAGSCRYGAQCVEAHGSEELAEWRERFEYRQMKLQRAREKELYGKSYTEQLLERWVQAPSPEKVMRERLEGIEESCSSDLVTTVSSKVSHHEWIFTLETYRLLRAVALLQDAHRNHFFLRNISSGDPSRKLLSQWEPNNDQEWSVPYVRELEQRDQLDTDGVSPMLEHKVKVSFATDIYGTFRQSVVFDFGGEPVLVRHLCVDVVPVTDVDRMKEIRKELVLSTAERWDSTNAEVIPFSSSQVPASVPTSVAIANDSEHERDLLNAYPSPRGDTFALTQSTVTEKKLTRNNYRARMHELLCVEEMARYEQVARYNLTAKLRLADCYLLAPSGVATSTAKYAHAGELFALMSLGKDVSEDTSAGRLILNNCTTVLITAANASPPKQESGSSSGTKPQQRIPQTTDEDGNNKQKRVVYEALIEDKGKNMIYLRLSAATVHALNMKNETDFLAEVQFQLNRIPYCEWHYAIDKIADFRVIFPDTYLEPSIPWTPQRQWSDILDSRLNLKQKEAVVAITTPVNCPLPPILIIGPFGTGKTYTLAQAIKQLLLQSNTRVLVCTHSNSAADLYIKDYLHPYVEAGHEEARPLRIYYHKRWVATVNQVVQKYCLIEMNGTTRTFRVPTLEDVLKHRVIVVTLSISMYLSTLGLQKGHFSHILLDEAAQAMECEAIMPLALANEDTRIVLAGDHMQLSPELFSQFAKERNLHVSLLERLYDHYPTTFPCKILLCENYRAHEAIIQFTSELFYDQKLISSSKQPRHEKFYPLTFFTTRGEDVQDQNSTAFYNNSEVYEVVERVCELRKKWPAAWGKMDDQSIGIMTPYADQVFRIRSELRKRRMGGISVERVLNVQGKQFRAIFLSTVRTRRTCHSGTKSGMGGDEMDYGFLSNSKLLNTAITRAQSLVAVVGDPVALCSIGRCRKVWERFIEICNQNKSLFGITWSYLRSQLDGVELKKTYVLNPLAPEFVPRQYQGESYIRMSSLLGPYGGSGLGLIPPLRFPSNPQHPLPPFVSHNMYPYQVYYLPPQPPSNPAFYPLRPPLMYPQPGGPLPPPLNPWSLNYPLVSPPAPGGIFPPAPGRNTPVGWHSKKKTAAQPAAPIPPPQPPPPPPSQPPDSRLEDERLVSVIPLPNRSPGSSGIKPSSFTPTPQGPSPPSPGSSLPDSYVPGGVISPASFLRPNLPSNISNLETMNNTFIALQGPAEKHLPNDHMTSRRQHDKSEQIQFLQNVHFPERIQSQAISQPLNIGIGDWTNLLPPNMTLAEMMESQSRQREWFMELLLISTSNGLNGSRLPKPSSPPPALQESFPPDMIRTLEELFADKNLAPQAVVVPSNQPQQHHPNGHIHIQVNPALPPLPERTVQNHPALFIGTEKPGEITPLSNIINNKPLMLRDLEASMLLAAGSGGGNPTQTQQLHQPQHHNHIHQQPQHQPPLPPPPPAAPPPPQQQQHIDTAANFGNGRFPFGLNIGENVDMHNGNNWTFQQQQQSVPLYRRQPQSSVPTPVQENMNLTPVHCILDGVVDKSTSGTSGAFAGYARAAVSIGLQREMTPTLPMGLSQREMLSQLSLSQQRELQPQLSVSLHQRESPQVPIGLPQREMPVGLQQRDAPTQMSILYPPHMQNQHQQQVDGFAQQQQPRIHHHHLHQPQHINTEFSKTNGHDDGSGDDLQRQNGGGTTYASVLRATPQKPNSSASPNGQEGEKSGMGDPFAVLRALGTKGSNGTPGLYHYFS
ncbi:probable helicase with zinc finger domain isoform X2 [Periplaneta americana]|uniref:probable helicase with zinc finger domain isoform X2 n=1 Tax=Periplaneta americana TaxID=6978 RepID=UPI0037E7A62C